MEKHVPSPREAPPTHATVLFMAANPLPECALALDEEYRSIDVKVQATRHRDAIEFKSAPAARLGDLQSHLMRYAPTVLHFSGHGADNREGLLFVGKDGEAALMSTRALEAIFRVLRDNIRLVVLNACHSEAQGKAIVQHVDCVVGMRKEVGDEAAITFAAAFYEAIAYGRSVQDAFDLGLAALEAHQIPEEKTPRLLAREGVNASEVFLVGRGSGKGVAGDGLFGASVFFADKKPAPVEADAAHAPPTRPSVGQGRVPGPGAGAAGRTRSGGTGSREGDGSTDDPKLREQIAIIESAVRGTLGLHAEAALGPVEWAEVQELSIFDEPITDGGVAWLARPDSGLRGLAGLILAGTQISDAGAAALAAKDSGLRSLAELALCYAYLGDAGAAVLAARDSGLRGLSELDLSGTQIGDAGARALAAQDSGLRGLIALSLDDTLVGDMGVAALAAKDSGLKELTRLFLSNTQVTDAGAAALAAKDSGLRALTTLDLRGTKVGKAEIKAIRKAHPKLTVFH